MNKLYIYSTKTFKHERTIHNVKQKDGSLKDEKAFPFYKVGQTTQINAEIRVKQQDGTSNPEPLLVLRTFNVPNNVTDKMVHSALENVDLLERTRVDADREWFTGQDENILDIIVSRIQKIAKLSDNDLKDPFNARLYQEEAIKRGITYLNNDGDKFYLMMKPRAGKNCTAIAIAQKTMKRGDVCFFISHWPSAFAGFEDDCETFRWSKSINVIRGDNNPETIKSKIKKNKFNFIMASVQALSSNNFLIGFYAKLAIFDESDYGMRTSNTTNILGDLEYKKSISLSGTDVYALVNETTRFNSYAYNLFDEYKLIEAGLVTNIPKIKTFACTVPDSVYEEVPIEHRDEVTRYFKHLFAANVSNEDDDKDKNTKVKLNPKDGLYYAGRTKIEFKYSGSVAKFMNTVLKDVSSGLSPYSLVSNKHGVFYFSRVTSIYAFYNLVKEHYGDLEIDVLIANEFKNDIQDNVKREIGLANKKNRRTIYATVGRMTRGGTVEDWTYVAKFTDGTGWATEHQKDLRCQSHKGEYGYIYDYNPHRCLMAHYQMTLDLNDLKHNKNPKNRESLIRESLIAHQIISVDGWKIKDVDYTELIHEATKEIDIVAFGSANSIGDIGDEQELLTILGSTAQTSKCLTKAVNEVLDADEKKGKGLGKLLEQSTNQTQKSKKTPLEILQGKLRTISSAIPYLVVLTEQKYNSLELLAGMKDSIKETWAKEYCDITFDDFKSLVKNNRLSKNFLDIRIEALCIEHDREKLFSLLSTSEAQKKQADVTTPLELVDEMLEKLDIDSWTTETRTLVPGCGSGNFLVGIQKKLLDRGFSYEEINEIVYAVELKECNVKIAKFRTGLTNIVVGDVLNHPF